jgi:hypothetical protein
MAITMGITMKAQNPAPKSAAAKAMGLAVMRRTMYSIGSTRPEIQMIGLRRRMRSDMKAAENEPMIPPMGYRLNRGPACSTETLRTSIMKVGQKVIKEANAIDAPT